MPSSGIRCQRNIQMCMWAMLMSEMVGPLAANRDLYTFDGIQNQQSQAAVKNIQIQSILDTHTTLPEDGNLLVVSGRGLGEWMFRPRHSALMP